MMLKDLISKMKEILNTSTMVEDGALEGEMLIVN